VGAITGYSGVNAQHIERGKLIRVGLGFLIGSCLALFTLGGLIGFVSQNLASSIGLYWKVSSGLLIILIGLLTLELVPFSLPKLLPSTQKSMSSPRLFGLALGGASTACGACCNPLIGVVFSIVIFNGEAVWGASLMASFALGFSLPMTAAVIGIQFGLGKLSSRIASWAEPIRKISGLALLLSGFYLIIES
jgi:cytochrome c biogenesis protein CcdA